MDPVKFGQFLQRQRKYKNMTQGELAGKIHVTTSAISKWERGLCLPEISKLRDLAEVLDLSLVELIECRKNVDTYTPEQASKTIETAITVSSAQKTKAVIAGILGFRAVLAILYARIIGYQYNLRPLKIHYGYSENHSREEIETAFNLVLEDFTAMKADGCKMLELEYAGDEVSYNELLTRNAYQSGVPYRDCIVVNSRFISPLNGGGAWSRHTLYSWQWIIMEDYWGNWKILSRGYP